MSEAAGYLLRIAGEQWVDHVFSMAIYYTSLKRKWKSGQTVLFVHKTCAGDGVVGYGVVERLVSSDELIEEEKDECEKGGWKRALEFRYVKRFEKPVLIKETFLRDSRLRGKFFHGIELTKNQLESILNQAESTPLNQKS